MGWGLQARATYWGLQARATYWGLQARANRMGQQNLTEQMLLNNRALRSDASEWDHGIAIVTYAFVVCVHIHTLTQWPRKQTLPHTHTYVHGMLMNTLSHAHTHTHMHGCTK